MMTISSTLIRRDSQSLSYLSASCPAAAENKKYGKINSIAAKLLIRLIDISSCVAA